MSKRRKLEQALSVVQVDDADGHKQIYSYAMAHMDPRGVPHIAALVYGARRVLLPMMYWEGTPALLDMFALAEALRQQTVADARAALVWDQFYQAGGDAAADGEALGDAERKILKGVAKESTDETQRETYRTVVMQVCWAHIHWLRRSDETYRIPLYFRRYFPAVGVLSTFESAGGCPLWLREMSQTELVAYDIIRGKVMEFLEDAEGWEEEYLRNPPRYGRNPKAIRHTPEYQKDFWGRFPLIVSWDTLAGILQRHLTKIQNMVTKLHSVFPESTRTPASDDEAGTSSPLRDNAQGPQGRFTHPFSLPDSRDDTKKIIPKVARPPAASGRPPDHDPNKDSQNSNVSSSRLSYVDVPPDVPHTLPTTLLPSGVEQPPQH